MVGELAVKVCLSLRLQAWSRRSGESRPPPSSHIFKQQVGALTRNGCDRYRLRRISKASFGLQNSRALASVRAGRRTPQRAGVQHTSRAVLQLYTHHLHLHRPSHTPPSTSTNRRLRPHFLRTSSHPHHARLSAQPLARNTLHSCSSSPAPAHAASPSCRQHPRSLPHPPATNTRPTSLASAHTRT